MVGNFEFSRLDEWIRMMDTSYALKFSELKAERASSLLERNSRQESLRCGRTMAESRKIHIWIEVLLMACLMSQTVILKLCISTSVLLLAGSTFTLMRICFIAFSRTVS